MSPSSPQSHVRRPSGPRTSRTHGAALVIVLAFVVLITGLMVAYFSRSVASRQLSNSSAGQTKSAILARSASDIIISGFKQEIAVGSTVAAVGSSGNQSNVYTPLSATNMVPLRFGTPTPSPSPNNELIPNLVRRSVRGDSSGSSAIPSPAAPSLASAVNSMSDPTSNGHSIALSRWDSHYLIPRYAADANTSLSPSQPDASVNFTAPDWVLMTRGGPAVETSIGSGSNALYNPIPSNQNYVVGRYAYAVYDEGGLLDMNVAGYPLVTPSPTPTQMGPTSGFTSTQISHKGALALADLTQLPVVKTPASSTDYLSSGVINDIIGWRNYAAAIAGTSNPYVFPGGTLPLGYPFTSTQASNWYTNFASNNVVGFMKVYGGTAGYTGPTDQALLSRQQLLRLRTAIGFSANALQYMGTFSRALEQPSFGPNPNRPQIYPATIPPTYNNITSYQGNNSYAGGDASINFVGVPGGFLSVRVASSFTRLDGSTAVVGEPLVKRKFALSHLTDVTTSATASQAASDPIYARFGLYRTSASSPWVYSHGSSTNILTLSQVAGQNREPDMAELLKAAINVGSVGKATFTNQGQSTGYTYDVSGDRQILQIMADLIDQTKSDNYPTQIKPFSSAASTLAISGVQDLPYFYNWHWLNLTTTLPSPLLTYADSAPVVEDSKYGGNAGTAHHMRPVASAAALLNGGTASCLIIPEIWNPHDANTLPAPGGGPTNFRVVAETTDPTGTLGYWLIFASPTSTGGSFDGELFDSQLNPPTSAVSTPVALTMPPAGTDSSNSALAFTDNSGGKAFREPTLLWRQGLPTGVTLSGTSRTEDGTATPGGALTGKTYYGILVGDTAVSWTVSNIATPPPSPTPTPSPPAYICQATSLHQGAQAGPSGGINQNITFRMQYKNPSGNWITYQNAFVEASTPDFVGYGLFVNPAEYDSQQYKNPMQHALNQGGLPLSPPRGGPYDPRTPRFASFLLGYWDKDDPILNGNPTLDAVTLINNYNDGSNSTTKFTAAQNQAVADSNFVLLHTQRPTTSHGEYFQYDGPGQGSVAQMHWYSFTNSNYGHFYGGLLSQNNPAVYLNDSNDTTLIQNYYEDADQVCRRAMGAYATLGVKPSPSPAASYRSTSTTSPIGLPMVTATSSFSGGIGTPTTQSQSRPTILHRPFNSVAEMGVAFRGGPWKNIDFFTPESGDAALLDVFCVNEPPSDAIVAGKVNLNTHQAPVLQALLAGAYRDELTTNALPALSQTEAGNIAGALLGITTNPTTQTWRGPLTNVADLVGHYVSNAGTVSGSDVYQYTSPASGSTYTYAGLSAALVNTSGTVNTPGGATIWDSSTSASSQAIQRFRESAIRPLAACGQTRVWNLMIDVIAQTGRYTSNSATLSQFAVDGETRYWVHVAIDRSTGEVIDKQTELVSE